MAGGIIYLDVDDEITSAASRIRATEGTRVAVVLPHGSRVATSRINFRLLARDAQEHTKRLSVVASDPATRALAASAGLPVFASVGEYEGSLPEGADEPPAGTSATDRAVTAASLAAAAAAAASQASSAAAAGPVHTDTGSVTVERASSGDPGPAPVRSQPTPRAVAAADLPAAPPEPPRESGRPTETGGGGRRRGIGRGPILAGLAVLLLAALVGGVAAYLLLPSATATVKARQETVGPLTMTISAATDVTEPDVENGVVPAQEITIPVEAQDTFKSTGKRVELHAATGTVRFSNYDFTSSNTIAKGSIVSTPSGIRFRTNSTITVPAATLAIPEVVPAVKSVKVTAVDQGPDGNVAPNSITSVPSGESPIALKVTNPDATSGGREDTFPRVTKKDVDAATAALTQTLTSDFNDRLDDPDLVSDQATVFPETATLSDPVFTPNPDDLVGQEVESFDLGASATGTVIAVDAAPVKAIAETRLQEQVDAEHQLVPDSSEVTVDDAVVSGDSVSFPVVATATQVRILDPAAIQAAILGKPEAEANAILDGYGESTLHLWPDWVGTVPTVASRVDVQVDGPTANGAPSPTPSPTHRPSPTHGPSPTVRPSGSPAEPGPS